MRDYTYKVFTDFIYIRLKGLVWVHNGLTNPNNLDKNACDELSQIYSSIEITKPLILDCKGISGMTDHAWDEFYKQIENKKREISFLNSQRIEQKITSSAREFCPSMKFQINDNCTVLFQSEIKFPVHISTIDEINNKILSDISSFVDNSFHQYKDFEPLASTPIFSNGEFDSAKLISVPESFFWTCIFLSDKTEEVIQKFKVGDNNLKIKILSVSLRSSPFAASVSLLLGLPLETVDHFGPVMKNFEPEDSLSDVNEYIYIGDFTVGGAEIKISKTYALMRNSKLEHAIVIASLFDKEIFREFNLHCLVYLEESCSRAIFKLKSKKL